MRNTMRRMENITFYDPAGIARHLEKMAARGWMLESRTNFTWHYRRITPARLHFAVTYFPQASDFDPEPSEQQRTFRDFCETAGWKHVVSWAQMQIFVNERENPVPMETDALVQVQTIHKAMKKNYLPSQLLLMAVALLNAALLIYTLISNPLYVLSSNTSLYTGSCWTLMLALCGMEIGGYYHWYHRAKKAAEQKGEFTETRRYRGVKLVILILMLCAMAFWFLSMTDGKQRMIGIAALLYVAVLMVMVNGVKALLKHKKVRAGINRSVTIASCFVLSFALMGGLTYFVTRFVGSGRPEKEPVDAYEFHGQTWYLYDDPLPLTIEDMMETDSSGYSREWTERSSVFLTQYEARQRGKLGEKQLTDLEYTITRVRVPAIFDFCRDSIMKRYADRSGEYADYYRYEPQDPALWGADEAYRRYSGDTALDSYLVCWGDKIVEITFYWEANDGQIEIAADKLKDT